MLIFLSVFSKGCCIYKKPTQFGESSSSDSEDECDHCHGHVEKKKKRQQVTQDVNSTINEIIADVSSTSQEDDNHCSNDPQLVRDE